jgi:hypothetical protein
MFSILYTVPILHISKLYGHYKSELQCISFLQYANSEQQRMKKNAECQMSGKVAQDHWNRNSKHIYKEKRKVEEMVLL